MVGPGAVGLGVVGLGVVGPGVVGLGVVGPGVIGPGVVGLGAEQSQTADSKSRRTPTAPIEHSSCGGMFQGTSGSHRGKAPPIDPFNGEARDIAFDDAWTCLAGMEPPPTEREGVFVCGHFLPAESARPV